HPLGSPTRQQPHGPAVRTAGPSAFLHPHVFALEVLTMDRPYYTATAERNATLRGLLARALFLRDEDERRHSGLCSVEALALLENWREEEMRWAAEDMLTAVRRVN